MAKYQYKVQQIPDNYNAQDVEDALNQGGRNGWMLNQIVQFGTGSNIKFFVIAVKVLAQ